MADLGIAEKKEWIRRHDEERLRYYEPHPKQAEFNRSQAGIRAAFCGNQSGKSFAGACDMALTVGKCHPWRKNYSGPVYGRVCCSSFGQIQSTHIPLFRSLLPRKPCDLELFKKWWPGLRGGSWDTAYDKEYHVINFADGGLIEFKTYDQDVALYAGPPRHAIWCDEEPPITIWSENLARQITTGINLTLTLTPLNYSQWIVSDIFQKSLTDPNVQCFKWGIADNPYADPGAIEQIKANITDPTELAARLYGDFTVIAGRVFKEYGDHNLCKPFQIPRHWEIGLVIDPHPEKATAVNVFARAPEGIVYVIGEGDFTGDVDAVCQQIRSLLVGKDVTVWLIDPSSRQSAGLRGQGRLIDLFRDRKYFPYLVEANNDRELGWATVARMSRNQPDGPRLRVFRSCPVTHSQMLNYSWKPPTRTGEDRRKADVVKRNDDHCDCIRYFCVHTSDWGGEVQEGFDLDVYGR